MTRWAIADTGPLVAFLDRGERYHAWISEKIRGLEPPLLVCEPVLTEAFFLLRRLPAACHALMEQISTGALRLSFHLEDHLTEVRAIYEKYRDRPISLADACLVRMSELEERHAVLTLDSDFGVYRKHGQERISLITPSH